MYAYVPFARGVVVLFYLQALKHFSFVPAACYTYSSEQAYMYRNGIQGKEKKEKHQHCYCFDPTDCRAHGIPRPSGGPRRQTAGVSCVRVQIV